MSVSSSSTPHLAKPTVNEFVAAESSGFVFTNGSSGSTITFEFGSGAPTGKRRKQGSLYINTSGTTSTTILYACTDGDSTWLGVGVL